MISWKSVQEKGQTSVMKTTFWGIVPTNSPSKQHQSDIDTVPKQSKIKRQHQRKIGATRKSSAGRKSSINT
jgi:hypothetical protein